MSFLTHHSDVLLRCDPELIYEILTDYDAYAEWMPFVSRSKLRAREGDLAIAEFELRPPTKGVFVVECIHTKNKMVLWRTLQGRVPVSEVQWNMESAGEAQTRVSLTLQEKMSWGLVALAHAPILRASRYLNALRTQISAFLPELPTQEVGEVILEISETSEGTVCWIYGKKYVLTPAAEGEP